MTVDPVGSTSSTPIKDVLGKGATPPAKDQFGQDTFLKLLVAQLPYQDPTSPMDGSQFLAQTAQFTSVEKLAEVAKLEGQLLATQRVVQASTLIGRSVTYAGPDGADVTGVVTAARLTPDGPVLRVGSADVPVAQVKEVRSSSA